VDNNIYKKSPDFAMNLNFCAQLIHSSMWIMERLFRKKADVTIWKTKARGEAFMHLLSDEALLDAYMKAIHLGLEREFIDLLVEEIIKRELHIPTH
jgi:developmental checkpoint coupling sporulation initiation to replication initiation